MHPTEIEPPGDLKLVEEALRARARHLNELIRLVLRHVEPGNQLLEELLFFIGVLAVDVRQQYGVLKQHPSVVAGQVGERYIVKAAGRFRVLADGICVFRSDLERTEQRLDDFGFVAFHLAVGPGDRDQRLQDCLLMFFHAQDLPPILAVGRCWVYHIPPSPLLRLPERFDIDQSPAYRICMTQPRYRAPFRAGGPAEIDEALAEKLLRAALESGGDYADLFFEYQASGSYAFDEGILKGAGRSVSMGLGVRVMKGDGTGYAYVEDFEWPTMLQAAKTAAQIASGGASVSPQQIATAHIAARYPVEQVSLLIPGADKRALLERADKAAMAADKRIIRVDASFYEELRELLVVSSDGRYVRDRQPLIRFGVRVIAEENGKRQSGSSGGGGRIGLDYFQQVSPEEHAKEAVRQAVAMLDARPAPAGEMEVVLGPGDSGILLHEAVGHGLEADFNRKGTSNYTGQVGKNVASELCTVVDDATLINSRGSINIDDEGNAPESITLIQDGILQGYMQDRHSADHFKVKQTGNGRRQSFRSHPMPRMTNTLLLAGKDDPEDILKSVKKGVYARKFGGGQVDISNGDFVFSLTEGYLIEDGKLTSPLKGVNLIGNGPEVMRKAVMLGHDFECSDGIWTCGKDGQSVPVGVGCPTIKISQLTVGGTEIA